ncbi:MAG TPA: hypothetical protein RMG48_18225 [Myxococcales bacterium LLY-WYZ-16_1]|nr:hypothetical protein [Myxococcales bacterium LLY-WYZ-16_1]
MNRRSTMGTGRCGLVAALLALLLCVLDAPRPSTRSAVVSRSTVPLLVHVADPAAHGLMPVAPGIGAIRLPAEERPP